MNCPRVSHSSTRVSSDKVEDPIMVDEEVISDMVGVGGSCRTVLYLTPDGVLVFLGDVDLRLVALLFFSVNNCSSFAIFSFRLNSRLLSFS